MKGAIRTKGRFLPTLFCILSVVLLLGLAAWLYTADAYPPDATAVSTMDHGQTEGRYTVFDGGGQIGFVFYPGGRVEHGAYAPLLSALAHEGITCILVQMPLNLAILGAGAWKEAIALAPEVTRWYIGGHSLGGAMACSAPAEVFSGVLLLAAYPTAKMDLPLLSICGTQDGVINRDKYQSGREYFAPGSQEVILEGGKSCLLRKLRCARRRRLGNHIQRSTAASHRAGYCTVRSIIKMGTRSAIGDRVPIFIRFLRWCAYDP